MNVDHIARAMTAGRPSPALKANVMAPIHGRPRPDFTQRVMNGIDVAPATRFSARVILVPAAIALAIVAAVVTRSREEALLKPSQQIVRTPTGVSPAPNVESTSPSVPQRVAVTRKLPSRRVTQQRPQEPAQLEHAPIYTIAALETTPGIATRSIEPTSCVIPALDGPASLKFPALPAAAGGNDKKDLKEK